MKRTNRGFAVYTEFTDSYGNNIRVQQSSSAERSCVWIFARAPNAENSEESPHLTRAQARRVAKALLRFANGK